MDINYKNEVLNVYPDAWDIVRYSPISGIAVGLKVVRWRRISGIPIALPILYKVLGYGHTEEWVWRSAYYTLKEEGKI